jgi:uncharacterized protein (DUF169 family)
MAKSLTEYGQIMADYLLLDNHVIGVKVHMDSRAYEDDQFPTHGHPMYYCYMVKLAMKGKTIKSQASGIACKTATKVLGLEAYFDDKNGPQDWQAIDVFSCHDLAYSKHHDLKPKQEDRAGISLGPLGHFKNDPDLVLLTVNGHQMMRLMQAYHFHNKGSLEIKMSGQCGVCHESTAHPFENQKMNISALCSGTRFICKWQDDHMMVSMPFDLLDQVVDGLIQTSHPCELDEKKKEIMRKRPDTGLKEKSNYFKS